MFTLKTVCTFLKYVIKGIISFIATPRNMIGIVLFFFFLLIVLVSFSIYQELESDPYSTYSFCFSEKCLGVIQSRFPIQLTLIKEAIRATAIVITFLSLWTGFNTYSLTLSNSILNNHIANFKLFCEYCDNEILKYGKISKSKLNYFKLYNLLYPNSKKGVFDEFECYHTYLLKVKEVVDESSCFYESFNNNRGKIHYDYRRHQYKLIKVLADFGIALEITHRNDFYFIESELFLFIDSITAAFTDKKIELNKLEKKYT
jgi:hypothetical protein